MMVVYRYSILISFVLIAALTGCEQTIQLDLEQLPQRIVINSRLTNTPGRQFVQVTKSGDFYLRGHTVRVENAIVSMHDDAGEMMTFVHNPRNHPDSSGYYLPTSPFTGIIDRTYSLSVIVDGQAYEASDKLLRVSKIDTLLYRVNSFAERFPPSDGKTYELLIYAKEPQETEDYYFIQYYRNDSLIYNRETDIYFTNDYGVVEDIDGIPSDVRYAPGDKGRVEMYSITRNGFIYYNDLATLLNSDGGMFSPPPSNPRTNLSNGALGFFQVSAMNFFETVVEE